MAERRIVLRKLPAATLLVLAACTSLSGSVVRAQVPEGTSADSSQSESPTSTESRLDKLQEELKEAESTGDVQYQGRVLLHMGGEFYRMAKLAEAVDTYQRALVLFKGANDEKDEARALYDLALTYRQRGEFERSLDYGGQALALDRALGDRKAQAAALKHRGSVLSRMGELQWALDEYAESLSLYREIKDRKGEAGALLGIGLADVALNRVETGIDIYQNQVLPLFREVGDMGGQGAVLNDLGMAYDRLGKLQAALETFAQAKAIHHQMKDASGEADAALNAGIVYEELGDLPQALEQNDLALSLFEKTGDAGGQASALDELGQVYGHAGMSEKALEYYNRALQLDHQSGKKVSEAKVLNNLGGEYSFLGKNQLAIDSLNQAVVLYEEIGDRRGHALALGNLGYAYAIANDRKKAADAYRRAFAEAGSLANPLLEEGVCYKSMLFNAEAQPPLAIFFGKLAVNALQQVRGGMEGMNGKLQDSFLRSKQDVYHVLADLLIAQNRLPEAQEVLDLLKKKEYLDYVRGEAGKDLEPIDLTPAEKLAQAEYQKSTSTIVALGEEWLQLKKMTTRSAEQEKQYQDLSDQLDEASKALNDYYANLYVVFGNNSEANKRLADVKGDVSQLKQVIAKQPHTVAIYTLVGSDRLSEIVITGSTVVARRSAISEKELNGRIAELQLALREPSRDPRAVAKTLYDVLIAPVQADLDQAKAETLVWSLDGALRYVPLAALYDGKQYLVERYNVATITPASIPHLTEKPDVESLTVAAMGISEKFEANLPPLPAVVTELNEVVKDPKSKDAQGTLPGTILLDAQFTEKAMEQELGGQHPVVHIASHFVFKPGDDSESYLLLAGEEQGRDGYHLTVAEFRDNQKLDLGDTDLLTLSACETGMSGNAGNGREVDGLGTTAQLKGAKAVISSLWEVNDNSTGELMADFYRRWVTGGGKTSKAEALRQAQLDLLHGASEGSAQATGRGLAAESNAGPRTFEHPYYWAPFVLMGNWR